MRNLSDLIILVRGAGEVGSAIAHRLYRSHFRVCITEAANPLMINRGCCFSEAVYDATKMIEGVTAEHTNPSLEQIYRTWRNQNIPIVVDPEMSLRALLKPDVLVNAMMLKRETNTKITDAPLVMGIGTGFTAGENVHIIVESKPGCNLGKLIFEGKTNEKVENASEINISSTPSVIRAEEAGVFTTGKNIGDMVVADEVIGYLGDLPLKAPVNGVLRGVLRNEVKVLGGTELAEIDPENNKLACYSFSDKARAISGGVLEAIMFSYNIDPAS